MSMLNKILNTECFAPFSWIGLCYLVLHQVWSHRRRFMQNRPRDRLCYLPQTLLVGMRVLKLLVKSHRRTRQSMCNRYQKCASDSHTALRRQAITLKIKRFTKNLLRQFKVRCPYQEILKEIIQEIHLMQPKVIYDFIFPDLS